MYIPNKQQTNLENGAFVFVSGGSDEPGAHGRHRVVPVGERCLQFERVRLIRQELRNIKLHSLVPSSLQ